MNSTTQFEKPLQLTDLFEVVANVGAQNHLRNNLAHIPVLGLAQQFEDVVLGVQQKLEGDRAMVVLEHGPIVVAEGLGVLHGDEERVIDASKQNLNSSRFKLTGAPHRNSCTQGSQP